MTILTIFQESEKHAASTRLASYIKYERGTAAIPAMQRAQDAQILVIGSAIGHQQSSHASAYAVSKAMAWSLVKCLSLELAPHQIAVNEWIPGPLHTSMNPAAANLPVSRQPDDPLLLNFFRYLCQMKSPMPSGQSFSLRPQP